MTFDSGDLRPSLVIEKKNDRSRRRLRVRRLKYTCRRKIPLDQEHGSGDRQTEKDDGSSMKILSVSFSAASENDSVLLSYGGEVSEGSGRSSYGVISVVGRRREMEDAVSAEVGFAVDGKYDFYGVYDGHGGSAVARLCRERLHEVVAEAVEREVAKGVKEVVGWDRVMEGCFGKMDEEVSGISVVKTVGSTALAAVVTEEQVVVANCGDCRAVLSRLGGTIALALSIDHKPDREDESERIESAGGRVINWNGSRVLGVLATSRSIGDQYLRPYVISKPEVTVTNRTDEDEFLILASDGLWDVISNELACQVVNKVFRRTTITRRIIDHDRDHLLLNYEKPLDSGSSSKTSEAATLLVDLAMARGSKDNISVIVVDLRKWAAT
ncbi:probable protein phosphatase 2C 8 [Argentina anserina]|uniref:probable protein phosphatase 2C 8 n=1 Tax=Argentina anserina TaxID=57926 RepID=UPI002176583C|nr:probable protein phosphatase 2C 8 [Potentilla anserina]